MPSSARKKTPEQLRSYRRNPAPVERSRNEEQNFCDAADDLAKPIQSVVTVMHPLACAAIGVGRHHEMPAGPQDARGFAHNATFVSVGNVFDDVEQRHDVERFVSEGERFTARRKEMCVGNELARKAERAARDIHADCPSGARRVGDETSVAATNIEQPWSNVVGSYGARDVDQLRELESDSRSQLILALVVWTLSPVIRCRVLTFLEPRLQRHVISAADRCRRSARYSSRATRASAQRRLRSGRRWAPSRLRTRPPAP